MPPTRVVAALIAFNEAGKIGTALDRFRPGYVTEAIVVDDGSTDGTTREVESRGITLLRQERRQGVGAAIRRAIRYAIDGGFDVLVIMAGNDKDRPEEIPPEWSSRSRRSRRPRPGSRSSGRGLRADAVLSPSGDPHVHPWLFSLLVRRRFTDSTNGFRAIRVALFNDPRLDLNQDWLDQYELEPYLLYKAIALGHHVTEVPVTKVYPPAHLGYTKMTPLIGWWSILRPIVLLGLGIKR